MKVDVLYCVEKNDINMLLGYSISSCIKNLELLNDIYVVTNDVEGMEDFIHSLSPGCKVHIINEDDIIKEKDISGWYKQQLIKLYAYNICETNYICCIGADAILLNPIKYDDLFCNDKQILYYNRYLLNQNHLEYERKRIENLASLVGCVPLRSYMLGDFIMELMVFKKTYLQELNDYICKFCGGYENLIRKLQCNSLLDKLSFGEWSLYAIYLLDIRNENIEIRNSNSLFVEQLHSTRDCDLHRADAKVVHFVDKKNRSYMVEKVVGVNGGE